VGTTSGAETVTVTNTGTSDLTVSAVELKGTNPGQFGLGTDTCTATRACQVFCVNRFRFV